MITQRAFNTVLLLAGTLSSMVVHAGEILNVTPLTTFNDHEDALWLFGANSSITNESSVRTFGISADALRTAGLNGNVVNTASGSIETHGDYFAVGIRTAGDNITIRNDGSIKTQGINGDGIVLFGNRNAEGLLSIADPNNVVGNLVLNAGTIETNGAGADAFVVEGDRTVFINTGYVRNNSGVQTQLQDGSAIHENGTAVWLLGINNQLLNSGSIRSTAVNSTTVQVGPSGSILNAGLIENSGGVDTQAMSIRDGAALLAGAGSVVENRGTIHGNVFGAFGGETLKLGPGSTVNGVVNFNPNGVDDFAGFIDRLEVDSGNASSSLDGNKFLGFNEFGKNGSGAMQLSGHLDLSSARLRSQAKVAQGDLVLVDASLTADQVLIGSGATLKGTGAIFGDVFIQQGGMFSVGQSPGEMSIAGDLNFNGGILNIEFGGLGAGLFDRISVDGKANFSNANIMFSFINGYIPTRGDVFEFLTAEAILGLDTARFFYSGLAAGFEFDLSATPAGTISFRALNDGVSSTVPEPGTLALLAFGLAGLLSRRRKPSNHFFAAAALENFSLASENSNSSGDSARS